MEKGIISKFILRVNTSLLGFSEYLMLLQFQKLSRQKEEALIDRFKKNPYINWVVTCGGNFDMMVELFAKNIQNLNDVISEIKSICGEYLRSFELITNILTYNFYSLKYLAEGKEEYEKVGRERSNTIVEIDDIDKEILKILNKQPRISFTHIAKKLKLSVNTVKYRINKLKKRRIIIHPSVIINTSKLNYQWYRVLLDVQPMTKKEEKMLETYAMLHPNIIYYHKGIGRWNIHFSILARNMEEFHNILRDIRNRFYNIIRSFETLIIFKEHTYSSVPFN
jgi:DNA-binding Lrp family transcriptional regulator